MRKKSGPVHPLETIRKGIGDSYEQFAKRLGISASIVKKIEGRKRDISQDVATRVFMETGVMIVDEGPEESFSYTRDDYKGWKETLSINEHVARLASNEFAKWIHSHPIRDEI